MARNIEELMFGKSKVMAAQRKLEEGKPKVITESRIRLRQEATMDENAIINSLIAEFSKNAKDAEDKQAIADEITTSFDEKGRYGDWGKSGSFKADGTEYNWIVDGDEAERIALDMVKQDLEDEPSIFNQDWLQGYITITDTDKRLLAQDLADSNMESMEDSEILEKAGVEDEYDETEDDDAKEKILDDAKEKVQSDMVDEIEGELDDPIQYFVHDQGMYSMEDLMEQNFISIDTDEAAKDAVSTDGWAHFLSLYDGNYEETKEGVVYFQE